MTSSHLLTTCLFASLAAAEPATHDDSGRFGALDLRLVYAYGPDSYTIQSTSGSEDRTWNRSNGLRLELFSRSPARVGLGGGVSLVGQSNQDRFAGETLDYQSLSGRLNLGLSLAPTPRWQFDVLPFAGYGIGEFELTGSGARNRSSEDFFEYGLNVNAVHTTARGLQVGAGLGYLVSESDFGLAAPPGPVDVQQQGPVYSVFIGTRW